MKRRRLIGENDNYRKRRYPRRNTATRYSSNRRRKAAMSRFAPPFRASGSRVHKFDVWSLTGRFWCENKPMYTLIPGLPLPILIPPRRIIAAALLSILCTCALAQRPGPNYTADMPSVDRVKAEIKGSDPTDTLARQFAVFTYLSTYIQRIKHSSTIAAPYTPHEWRVMGAYDSAKCHISLNY